MKGSGLLGLILVLALGCASSGAKVQRIGTDTTVDLSGRWNDADSRMVAETMLEEVLRHRWLTDFVVEQGRKPVVIVGRVRNLSHEHINVATFIADLERELINSGQITFVASPAQREEIRQERLDQQRYASEESAKKLAAESGADFMLQGAIKTIQDAIEGERVMFYQTDLELINIESNQKVWIGSKKIKKVISRKKYKW